MINSGSKVVYGACGRDGDLSFLRNQGGQLVFPFLGGPLSTRFITGLIALGSPLVILGNHGRGQHEALHRIAPPPPNLSLCMVSAHPLYLFWYSQTCLEQTFLVHNPKTALKVYCGNTTGVRRGEREGSCGYVGVYMYIYVLWGGVGVGWLLPCRRVRKKHHKGH